MNLYEKYTKEMIPTLMEEFKFKNVFQAPKILKVTISVGAKEALENKKVLEAISEQLGQITGQKTVVTKAKKAIATFKLRIGDPIGVMVTLRGKKMYDFLEKLTNVVLPRVRDFHGVPKKSFDGRGNYSLGIKEQIVFPEVEYDKVDKVRGLEITINTSTKNDDVARRLLELFGMPFEKEK